MEAPWKVKIKLSAIFVTFSFSTKQLCMSQRLRTFGFSHPMLPSCELLSGWFHPDKPTSILP